MQHIIYIPGAAKAPFGLCFSAAVILAPKQMEKGPSSNQFIIHDLIFLLLYFNLMLSTSSSNDVAVPFNAI